MNSSGWKTGTPPTSQPLKKGGGSSGHLRRHSIAVESSQPATFTFGSLAAAQQRILVHGQTISEAKEELRSIRRSGRLEKRGFRHFRSWRCRGLVLAGRLLKYFELEAGGTGGGAAELLEMRRPRGVLEITSETVVGKCRESAALPAG